MQTPTHTSIHIQQNNDDSISSCFNHMSQLKSYAQDHEELNEVNGKKEDTVIFENQSKKDYNSTGNIKEQQYSPQKQCSISYEYNKGGDGDKKKTLAQLRIQRIKISHSVSKDFSDSKDKSDFCSMIPIAQTSQFCKKEKEPLKIMLALNLLVSVKNFYRQVTKNTRIFQRLTQEQHAIIGDVSSMYQKKKNIRFKRVYDMQKLIMLLVEKYLPIIPVFTPYHTLKRIWDLLNAILIISLIFIISLQIFFKLDTQEFMNLNKIALTVFVSDIFLNINTATFDKGNLIVDRKKIALQYLKTKLVYDILGISPFIINFLNFTDLNYTFLLFILKLFSVQETFDRITFYLNYQKDLKNMVDLFKLILILCVICHVFCGFWHGLALYEISNGSTETWLHKFHLENASIFSRYVYSFYFLAVTMITVGYGDITPQNTTEMIFTILTMFATGITWGYSINKIGNIIDNIEKKDKSYRESMQVIHTLMREENIVTDLRDQVSNYLNYLYKESNEVQKKQEQKVIEKLSNQLRHELISNIQGQYLENIPFIKAMQQKNKIIFLMEECLFSPGETIFKENSIDDCSLYYIVKGEIEILKTSNSKTRGDSIISVLQKQSYFGEISFITGQIRDLTVKTTDFCRIYKINRERFLNLIKENDQDYEEFNMMKENIVFKHHYSVISKKCFHCQSDDHFALQCPKTHLTISLKVIANRYSFSVPHLKRLDHKRSKHQQWRTLMKIDSVFSAVYQINDNEEYFDLLNEIEEKAKQKLINSTNTEFEDTENSVESDIDEDEEHCEESSKIEEFQKLTRRNGLRKVQISSKRDIQGGNQSTQNSCKETTSLLTSNNDLDKYEEGKSAKSSISNILVDQMKSLQYQISNLQGLLMVDDGSISRQQSFKPSSHYITSMNKILNSNSPLAASPLALPIIAAPQFNNNQDDSTPKTQKSNGTRKQRKSLSVGWYQVNQLNLQMQEQKKGQHYNNIPNKFPSQKIISIQAENEKASPEFKDQQNSKKYSLNSQQGGELQKSLLSCSESKEINSKKLSQLNALQEQFKSQNSHQSHQSQFDGNNILMIESSNGKQVKPSILKQKTRSISRIDNISDSKDLKELQLINQSKKYESMNQSEMNKLLGTNSVEQQPVPAAHKRHHKSVMISDQKGLQQLYKFENSSSFKTLNQNQQPPQMKYQSRLSHERSFFIEGSYFMLQYFDKAHIFKYYHPHNNYNLIVKLHKKLFNPQGEPKSIKKKKSLKVLRIEYTKNH